MYMHRMLLVQDLHSNTCMCALQRTGLGHTQGKRGVCSVGEQDRPVVQQVSCSSIERMALVFAVLCNCCPLAVVLETWGQLH